ncbi:condensation domain-containing protein [Streptomyces malaysiensis]|uniref:condensation domain-containing protein n=1 Tax=Streptomyces malaysiensis TaxID=92644 RepID=UPI000C2B7742
MVHARWCAPGPGAGVLTLTVHHLGVDGVSWRILRDDLDTAWDAVRRGRTPTLQPTGTSFAQWRRRWWGTPITRRAPRVRPPSRRSPWNHRSRAPLDPASDTEDTRRRHTPPCRRAHARAC